MTWSLFGSYAPALKRIKELERDNKRLGGALRKHELSLVERIKELEGQLALKEQGLEEVVNMHLRAEKRVRELEGVLRFYADGKFWQRIAEITHVHLSAFDVDTGQKARAAMGKGENDR